MTLPDPARRPCINPARPCDDPATTLRAILPGSKQGGLACDYVQIEDLDPAETLPTPRGVG